MPSNVDITKPTSGRAWTADVRDNMRTIRDEHNVFETDISNITAEIDAFNFLTEEQADDLYLRRDITDLANILYAPGFRIGASTSYSVNIAPNFIGIGNSGSPFADIALQAINTNRKSLRFLSQGGQDRFSWHTVGQEIGGSQGANLFLERTLDNTTTAEVLRVERSTGNIVLTSRLMLGVAPTIGNEAATKQYVDDNISISAPDLTEYAKIAYVDDEILHAIEALNISDYATIQYVDDNYATIQYVDDKIGDIDFSSLATIQYVNDEISKIVMPDLTPYALTSYVDQQIQDLGQSVVDAGYLTSFEADNRYYTKTQSNALYINPAIGAVMTGQLGITYPINSPGVAVHKQYVDDLVDNFSFLASETFIKRDGTNDMNGVLRFASQNYGVVWPTGGVIFETATGLNGGLRIRRSLGQDKVITEDNSGGNAIVLLDARDARANSQVYNLIGNVILDRNGTWTNIWSAAYSIPRGGPSRVTITVLLNFTGMASGTLAICGVRLPTLTNIERYGFVYAAGTAGNPTITSVVITLVAEMNTVSQGFMIEAANLGQTAGGFDLTVVGGGDTVANRSQVMITDLGPR